jgi:hypothetical protein
MVTDEQVGIENADGISMLSAAVLCTIMLCAVDMISQLC